jgi:hypothetical protein
MVVRLSALRNIYKIDNRKWIRENSSLALPTVSGLEALHCGNWYCREWFKTFSRENQNTARKRKFPF